MEPEQISKKEWIERLKAFLKTLRGRPPRSVEADYSRWRQSEAEYQKEQAEWLAAVRRRKAEKQEGLKDADRKSD